MWWWWWGGQERARERTEQRTRGREQHNRNSRVMRRRKPVGWRKVEKRMLA